jgi:hypothetical protein
MIEYYAEDESRLRDELLCFKVLLERAKRLPEDEMQRVLRRIHMFDPLLEEDPWVKEKVAEGELKGELKGARTLLVDFIESRFPSLAEIAQTKATQIEQLEVIHSLSKQLWVAPDEQAARALLEAQTAV